jgi:hypothetical protein
MSIRSPFCCTYGYVKLEYLLGKNFTRRWPGWHGSVSTLCSHVSGPLRGDRELMLALRGA